MKWCLWNFDLIERIKLNKVVRIITITTRTKINHLIIIFISHFFFCMFV